MADVKILTADEALANATHHHYLSRSASSSIEQITSELVGLHNTSPVSPYLSIRARRPGFKRVDLDEVMWGSWSMARIRAMRLTIFVFPHDLLEIASAATRAIGERLAARWLRDSGLSQSEFNQIAGAVDTALANGPLTVRGLRRALHVSPSVDLPGIVGRMCDLGQLVGGAPPGSWRSPVRLYHRWLDVLPHVDLRRWDPDHAIRELIRRYVTSYGPVTLSDISWWTGVTKVRCRAALADLDTQVEEVAVDGWPGPLYRIAGSYVESEPGTRVIALPLLDPYVQGYRDRSRFLDRDRHAFVYDGGGNATATLLHRGRIVGVWQVIEEPAESIRYHLFAGGPGPIRRAAEADLAAAGAVFFDRPVDVEEVATMKPLNADGGRSASHPLDRRLHRASRRAR